MEVGSDTYNYWRYGPDAKYIHKNRQDIIRPSWDSFFLKLAIEYSTRSHDAQTKCGCVLVDQDHHIVGAGYNGFPADIMDDFLPNVRPTEDCHPSDSKYTWMDHAEYNAVFNCVIPPKNGIAYITGKPCFPCLKLLYRAGIREVICGPQASSMRDNDKNYNELVEEFLWRTQGKLKIRHLPS